MSSLYETSPPQRIYRSTASMRTILLAMAGAAVPVLAVDLTSVNTIGGYTQANGIIVSLVTNFALTTLCWGAAFAVFVRRTKSFWSVKGWMILFWTGAILTAGLAQAAHTRQAEQARVAVNGMRNAFQAAQSGKPTAAASMATGDLGKIQTLVQQALAREAETKKAYLAEFTAVGLADFLKPGKISTRTDFAAVHAKARQAYAVIDKFEQRHAADLESFKQAVQALDVAPNPKADALRGMEQGVARGQAQQQKLDSLDREIVQVIDETATLLEHNRSHWIVQSGKFTFNDPALLSAFRQKLGMVEELGREENRVLVNMRANGEANLDRMDAAIQ